MGRHDDGRARAVDSVKETHDAQRRLRVKVAGGLVREQQLGAVHHGARDSDTLLLTTGQLVRQARFLAGQAHQLEGVRDGRLDRMARLADNLHGQSDVLVHGLGGQQSEVLEDRADLAAQLRNRPRGQLGHVLAEHPHLAAGRLHFAHDELQERGLAGT